MRSHQVTGEHLLGERHLVDWSLSASGVNRNEPDRSDLAYIAEIDPATGVSNPVAWFGGPRSADPDLQRPRRGAATRGGPTTGSSSARRPAPITGQGGRGLPRRGPRRGQPDLRHHQPQSLARRTGRVSPEQIFAGPFAEDSRLSLFINAFGGRYDAEDRLRAGYAQVEMPDQPTGCGSSAGARVEHWTLDLNTLDPQGQAIAPSRATTPTCCPRSRSTTQLTDDQILRALGQPDALAARVSRDLDRPARSSRSAACITFGNPNLQRALIQNYDARWEWYPRPGEMISVGVFAKRFNDPIERVFVEPDRRAWPTASSTRSRADNYGVELEVRKSLDFAVAGPRPPHRCSPTPR